MSQTPITPTRLAEAVTRLAPALQEMLPPEEWTLLRELPQAVQAAADERAQRLVGVKLVNWLAEHPSIRERVLLEATLLADLRAKLGTALAQQARALGLPAEQLDAGALDAYVEAVLRGVQPEVAPGGEEATRQIFATREKATLASLRNIWLRPDELLQFLASAAFTAQDVFGASSRALVGAGVIWLVHSLYNLATENIGGADAVVLWGLWHACGRTGRQAPLHRILEETNKTAGQSGLPALTEAEALSCLQRLERLGIADRVGPNQWLLREKCRAPSG